MAVPGDSLLGPQELFKKVVPSHCLGSIWSKRNKPGNEHLAPTVRAAITHYQSVTSCVITTCLRDLSMTAQDRARVVEYWIQVAQVCWGVPVESHSAFLGTASSPSQFCGLSPSTVPRPFLQEAH